MRKRHISIPEPSSRFHNVKCADCGESMVVYSHVSTRVTCNFCGNVIAEPTGSKASIRGEITGSADSA